MVEDEIEGDATKQYSLLWRYNQVLTLDFKHVHVEHITLTWSRMFQILYICLDGCKKGFVEDC